MLTTVVRLSRVPAGEPGNPVKIRGTGLQNLGSTNSSDDTDDPPGS